jgi:Zn-dependent protease with chaperone function
VALIAVALTLLAAMTAPHLLPLRRVTPIWAAGLWLAALALRAFVATGAAIFVFIYMPETGLFRAMARWCLHDVLPFLSGYLGFSGHPLAHVAAVLPTLSLGTSLLCALFGICRAWLALHRRLSRALGEGPFGSTVVPDDGVVIGVTGLGRTRIVVSESALTALDEEELEASFAHELGHIRRRHRPLLLAGSVFAALARLLPGSRAAARELAFHLERDADEYAVARTRDPLALASAICKAATGQFAGATSLGGRGRMGVRLEYLVDGAPARGGPLLERGARGLAVLLTAMALVLAASVPAWALATPDPGRALAVVDDCDH